MELAGKERLDWERPLILRAQEGDQEAFSELYRAYAPVIYARILIGKLGSRDAAEDALIETFRSAYERLGTFTPKGVSVYHWFARIASNKAMDAHRKNARRSRALVNFESLLKPLFGDIPGPDTALDAAADARALQARVRSVLDALNPRYALAIDYRFFKGLERAQCAEAMDVKIGTFDVVLLRALKAFRKRWERHDDE